MAKPPPDEYFRVTCNNVSKTDLGSLMALLSKIGISDVHFDLVTDVPTFKRKVNHEVKSADFLREWIKDHPTFKAKEAVTHFDLHGRTAGAAYTGLRELVEQGVLRKLGEGNYTRKDVKHLAAPKKAKPKPKPEPDHTKRYDVSHADVILQAARENGGSFNRADMMKVFKQRRRPPQSVGTGIKALLVRGMIERIAEGEYKILRKPVNGAAPTEAEASNG